MKIPKFDKKNLVIYSVYLVLFLTTIVVSLFNVGLDLTLLFSSKYLGNLCLNYSLSIITVAAAMKDSEMRELQKDYYLNSCEQLIFALNQIKDRSLETIFKFYTKKRFKDLRNEYIYDVLFKNGIKKEYYDMSHEELKLLIKNDLLNNEQYSIIRRLKKGKFKFREVSSEEILNDYEKKITYQDMRSNKNKIIISRIAPKFVLIFAVSAIFTSAVLNENSGGVGQILTDLVSRLINIITAMFAGYMVGPEIVQDKINLKNLKKLFCREFISDFDSGVYVPTEEEISSNVLNKIKEMSAIHVVPDANYSTSDAEDEEIELTEEELKIIKDNRKNNSTPA